VAEPRYTDSAAKPRSVNPFTNCVHNSDDLVTGNERQFGTGQIAVHDVEVSAANGARFDAQPQFANP